MELATVEEAATMMGVSVRTVWRKLKADELQSHKQGGRVMVDVTDLTDCDTARDTGRQMTQVAAAQLAIRHQDSERWERTLAEFRRFEDTLRDEMRLVSRGRQVAIGAVIGLVAILGAVAGGGAWWHRDQQAVAEREHGLAVAEMREQHVEQVAAEKGRAGQLAASVGDLEGQVGTLNEELTITKLSAAEDRGRAERLMSNLNEAREENDELQAQVQDLAGAEALMDLVRAAFGSPAKTADLASVAQSEPAVGE